MLDKFSTKHCDVTRGAGHQGHGDGNNEGFVFSVRSSGRRKHILGGEDHAQRYEKQQDASGNAQGGRFQPQQVQQEFSGKEEKEQQAQRKYKLPCQNSLLLGGRVFFQHSLDHGRQTHRVDDDEQKNNSGKEVLHGICPVVNDTGVYVKGNRQQWKFSLSGLLFSSPAQEPGLYAWKAI